MSKLYRDGTLLFIAILLATTAHTQEKNFYNRVYLSGKDAAHTKNWDFKVSSGQQSGKWSTIPVPSNWELQGFGSYNYGKDYNTSDKKIADEIGSYRYKFSVPKSWKGKWINIVFDGSMTDTKVKINGKSAGPTHQGSFYRFKYNISDFLEYGKKNLLEVEVAKRSENESVNKAEREADFWIFGGIFRPVFLEVLPQEHFERIAIEAKANGRFIARLFLNKSLASASAKMELFSQTGEKIESTLSSEPKNDTTLIIQGQFDAIDSWNPEKPVLYNAKFSLYDGNKKLFEQEEKIGFRTVALIEKDGIYVNGERVILKGVDRHSFWPTTGRALSDANNLEDVLLIKEMNMNAVRMSHYPPDEKFLQLCDSLGLFVLDELTGWQDGYDTIVGPKLIKEMIFKDENHPSIIIWDHGNEGGWNFENEKWFHVYDFQKRPIIYPWLKRNGVDTHHYPEFNYGIDRLKYGKDIFFPTEFLHGLYDGGHGAGLSDYWGNYMVNPSFAGIFLWSFADEAVVRTDKGGIMDAAGNQGPDGILGPYHQKEGSFYTIKKIWSPVQIKPMAINHNFKGKIHVENRYIYTNLNTCTFKWEVFGTSGYELNKISLGTGTLQGPDVLPGETGTLQISVPEIIKDAEIFSLTAYDDLQNEIYNWSWPIKQPKAVAEEIISSATRSSSPVKIKETEEQLIVNANVIQFYFNKKTGNLDKIIKENKGEVSLNGGPVPVGVDSKLKGVNWKTDKDGNFDILVEYDNYPSKLQWTIEKSGLLRLECAPALIKKDSIDFIGISFNYPEDKVNGVRWMGNGPYRIWKNRLDGAEFGVWQKDYNNTVTGSDFENIEYPEFKGYHSEMYWMELETDEFPIRIATETPGLFFRLFTPDFPEDAPKYVTPPFPEGNISFLYEIPAIGTKFKNAERLGPSSQKGNMSYHKGDKLDPIILWFDLTDY